MKQGLVGLFVLAVVVSGGCASQKSGRCPFAHRGEVRGDVRAEITAVLERQAAAWNNGDVEGFMQGYWNSPELSFSSGGKVTRGFEPTANHFRTRYPDRAAMGHLTFSDLEVTLLGRDAALVLGRYRVDSSQSSTGAFSLTMRRIDGSWLVIHDHTSRDAS
jgi:beta-aspartyl-peptidase (threonine type)